MKNLFILLIILFAACTPEISVPTIEAPVPESNAINYVGYHLYSLQTNEDGSYRIAYYLSDNTIEVFVSVPASNVIIERGKSNNVSFKQFNNGLFTGRFVIYLTNDFIIGKFFN